MDEARRVCRIATCVVDACSGQWKHLFVQSATPAGKEVRPFRARHRGLKREAVFLLHSPYRCVETDRLSWLIESHPHGLTSLTLPAPCVPLVSIGASWADSMPERVTQNPPSIPDIRLHALPTCHYYRSVSLFFGGVHIRRVSDVLLHRCFRLYSGHLVTPRKGGC